MKCLVVNYELELIYGGTSFTKECIPGKINIIFDENIYIINNGDNEHLEFMKEYENILKNMLRKVINYDTLREIESKIMQLLHKYQEMNCIITEDSFMCEWIVKDTTCAVLNKNYNFKFYEENL